MKVMEIEAAKRPRERAVQYGISFLHHNELIAILLRSGYKGKSAIELADEILALRPTLNGLTNVSLEELMAVKGVKEAKALEILACFELSRRMAFAQVDGKVTIQNPKALIHWLNTLIGYQEQEHFMILFLNQKLEMITYKEMFVGLHNSCNVSAREVLAHALRINAIKLILVHNHPSGHVEPSAEDIQVTHNFVEAGKICGIECLDHLIVGQNHYFSFKEKQMIAS